MTRLPALFISHGAPDLVLHDGPAYRFLAGLGNKIRKPKAILLLSAHFDTPHTAVTAGEQPETIYDFRGFPEELYQITYPASGDPALAKRVSQLLLAAGISVNLDSQRGFDHGAWIPLSLMYPDADVPVVQLSIDSRQSAHYHFSVGKALQPLRNEGVLIIGSGGATHNISYAFQAAQDEPLVELAKRFREWLAAAVADDRRADLAEFRTRAPDAAWNHPSDEHLLPLLYVMGTANDGESGRRIHASSTYGSLAMDAYLVGE